MDYEDLLMLQHQLEEFHQSIRDAEHIFAIHNDIFPRSLLVSEIKIISENSISTLPAHADHDTARICVVHRK